MGSGVIDSDGHVFEKEAELNRFLEKPYNRGYQSLYAMLPSLDGFHTTGSFQGDAENGAHTGGFNTAVGAKEWVEYLEKSAIESAILFPTWGLAHGVIVDPEWAASYARSYNRWLYETYMRHSPRLKGMALLPIQNVPAAIQELRRAVKEYGMPGGMLSSNPNGVGKHVSAREFWPIYEEAQRLDVCITFHGGGYTNLGFNTFTNFGAIRALGHPWPLAVATAGLICDGVLDTFPKLRVGMMEGGASWVALVVDRLEREVTYGGLRLKRPVRAYFEQIYLSVEAFDAAIIDVVRRVGPESVMYSTDFPHEVAPDDIIRELDRLRARNDLSAAEKQAILGDNARRLYRLPN